MKKILIAVGLVFAGFAASAQVSKGTITAGGNLGFGTSKIKDSDGSSNKFSIQPQVGYFFADKLEGYAKLGYANSTDKNGTVKDIENQFGGGLGLRKYFMVSDNVAIFAGPEVSYYGGNLKTKTEGAATVDGNKTNTLSANINAGVGVFFTKNIGLVAGLGVLSFDSKTTKAPNGGGKSTSNSFGLLADNAPFSLGIAFHF